MDELTIAKKRYISSKRAAKLSGYTKDYIGQLARAGALPAKMVGRSWYIEEDALKDHRKTYKGEPLGDDTAWDINQVEEDSRSLSEIAAGYIDEQEKEHKKKLLDELFDLKYEGEDEPLFPEISKESKKEEQQEQQEQEDAEEDTPIEISHTDEIVEEEEVVEEVPSTEPVVEPPAPLHTSRVAYIDVDEVRQPAHKRPPKRPLKRRIERRSGSPLIIGAFVLLILLGISSLFMQQRNIYEQGRDTYVEAGTDFSIPSLHKVLNNLRAQIGAAE